MQRGSPLAGCETQDCDEVLLPEKALPATPHWTPKFTEQMCFDVPDEAFVRPVAVTMSGDLVAERVSAARAVARMDPTLNLSPVRRHRARLQSQMESPAAEKSSARDAASKSQVVTALPAGAH